jgi:hypothetical protein
MALEQVFFVYFGLPCQFSFHQLLRINQSSYDRRCIASINNKRKEKDSENFPAYIIILQFTYYCLMQCSSAPGKVDEVGRLVQKRTSSDD